MISISVQHQRLGDADEEQKIKLIMHGPRTFQSLNSLLINTGSVAKKCEIYSFLPSSEQGIRQSLL